MQIHVRKNQYAGFTLIELMVTVAIIAILATVALPSYQNHVMRANRSAAASFLMEVANMQERYYLDARAYAAVSYTHLTLPTSDLV